MPLLLSIFGNNMSFNFREYICYSDVNFILILRSNYYAGIK